MEVNETRHEIFTEYTKYPLFGFRIFTDIQRQSTGMERYTKHAAYLYEIGNSSKIFKKHSLCN